MHLMETRLEGLQNTLIGFERTGTPLVAFSEARGYYLAGFADDIGLYYLVPLICRYLQVPLSTAVEGFLWTVLGMAFMLGTLGCMFLFRRAVSRVIAGAALAVLALLASRIGDVYLLQAAAVMGLVPGLLALVRSARASAYLTGLALPLGLLIGAVNLFRSHAGDVVAVFLVLLVLGQIRWSRVRRGLVVALCLLGMALPGHYLSHLQDTTEAYLHSIDAAYEPSNRAHPFWHSVYLGLGFIVNDLGITYKDEVAFAKVRELAPETKYNSPQYEAVLRQQIWQIVRSYKLYALMLMAAKTGVIAMYLLVSANFGLWAAWRYPKTRDVEWAFAGSLAFAALPGLLVIPYLTYCIGFVVLATIYGVVSLGEVVERRRELQPGVVASV